MVSTTGFGMLFSSLFMLFGLVAGQGCSSPTVRQEWRQLSEAQKQQYLNAVKTLKSRTFNGDDSADMATWNHDMFTQVHWKYQQNNHGKPAFLPWHRRYIAGYESALRSIDPGVSLPYWDWRLDSQNPRGSDMFTANHFGGNGDPANNNCVGTGLAAGWVPVQGPNSGTCLKRCNDWKVLYSPESVAALIGTGADYNTFYASIEGGPHASVHNQMGGSCGDFSSMASSNDPVFFLHHAMVDKTWWLWQQSCAAYSQLGPGSGAHPPFGNINVFSTTTNGLCYSYSQSAGDAPYKMNCPTGQVSPWGGAPTSTSSGSSSTATGTSSTTATSTPLPPGANTWLQNAIIALVPIPSLSKVVQNSAAIRAVSSSPAILRKRQVSDLSLIDENEANTDFCHWWGNIKCSTLAPDDYLKMMHMSDDQIALIHKSHQVTCAAVQKINADPTRNSTASLMYFAEHNPGWTPPQSCL